KIASIAAKRGNPNTVLRLTVESGGCYGFQYKFDITDQLTEDDAIFECEGGRLVVDDVSLSLMDGSKVDFVQELIGSTFQVVHIAKASSGCGCGSSFDINI
ncbi:[4Fe-4S] proteins maturation, partial [Dispira parvispora]